MDQYCESMELGFWDHEKNSALGSWWLQSRRLLKEVKIEQANAQLEKTEQDWAWGD